MQQPHFANARSVRNALDRLKLRQANRLMAHGGAIAVDELTRIDAADIRASRVFRGGADADENLDKIWATIRTTLYPAPEEHYSALRRGDTRMKKGRRPIILGIVGDSAAGKTTLTRGLVNILGPERVTHVCTDDYHKYDRVERAQIGISALHPDCNYMDVMELHLERLHYGQPILKPVYNHSNGTLVRPEYVQPREFVIVEGLLGFSTATLRQFFDVKVFLDPPEELRHVWKIRRDTTKRGYTPDQVRAELVRREPDSRDFIRPQRAFADMVISFYPPAGTPPEECRRRTWTCA